MWFPNLKAEKKDRLVVIQFKSINQLEIMPKFVRDNELEKWDSL